MNQEISAKWADEQRHGDFGLPTERGCRMKIMRVFVSDDWRTTRTTLVTGRFSLYFDFRRLTIGYTRGFDRHYVNILPGVVIDWPGHYR